MTSVLALCLLSSSSDAADNESPLRVRIAWGGGAAKQWRGQVRIDAGLLSNPQPLGIEADEPGSMWIEAGALRIEQKTPRGYDAVDLDLVATPEAVLRVDLQDAATGAETKTLEIPVQSLLNDSATHDLDDTNNRLIARRAPGDALHVTFEHRSLVFSPGETFACRVTPRHLPVEAGSRARFRFQLRDSAGGRVLWTDEAEQTVVSGEGLQIPITFKLPNAEGVYDLEIEAFGKRNPLALNLRQQASAARKVQLVVVGSQPAPSSDSALTAVFEIDPARPRWWERLTNLSALSTARRGPLGTGHAHVWQHPLGAMVQLSPGPDDANPSWEAYPLEVREPGQPHVLEVEYPSDVPQTVAISVVESGSTGSVAAVGLDSGIYVPDEAAAAKPEVLTHRLVFWPKTKNPQVLMTNLRTSSRAVYGRIRILATGGRLPRDSAAPNGDERLIAGYFDRPLFPENFGAAEAFDAVAGRGLDDWNTFYQGSTRLADYLRFAGYNGLMLSILADGSSLYPSAKLQSSPRYDSGVFQSLGQDPVQKDVVELLLRVFDREQLRMIPALCLATPLSELEELKRTQSPAESGIEWVGRDGRTWTQRYRGDRGQAPYYNPLNPRVQEAILEVVDEVATRYADHASMVGLALQLSADSYLQLPGLGWGFDDQTVAAYESETGNHVPAAGPTRTADRAAILLGPQREAWRQWRAARMLDFYQRLHERIASARPDLKLYLAGSELFKSQELRAAIRPGLSARAAEETMLEIGIDAAALAQQPGMVLLRTQQIGVPSARATPLFDLKANEVANLDQELRGAELRGAIFYHPPHRQPLPSFDQRSPQRGTHLWLVSQLSPAAERNRQRFARSIAALDTQALFDGGWLLNLGQEDATRQLMHTFRRLPQIDWKSLELDTQPITIRQCVTRGQSYVYLVNESPWPAEVSLQLQNVGESGVSEITGERKLPEMERTGAGAKQTISLAPYDLLAFSSTSPNLVVKGATIELPESAGAELESRIRDFQDRAGALGNQAALDRPHNADFEQPASDDGTILGWTRNDAANVAATLDAQTKHGGGQSVRFATGGAVGILASDEFVVPATGRLEVGAWLRVQDAGQQPSLRIALEGTHRGERFYRHAQLGAASGSPSLATQWSQYVALFDNLPVDGESTMRVRFELYGRGEVWIDDVKLHHLRFSEAERFELYKLATSAQLKLKDGDYADCLRLLEGYWPQFLAAQVPLTETPLAQRPVERQAALPAAPLPEPAPEKGNKLLEGIKSWLPKWR